VAVDSFGNVATTSQTLVKDTLALGLTVDGPITADNVINNAEANAGYTFTGNAEPGARVDVTVTDANSNVFRPVTAPTAGADGRWSATINLSTIRDGAATVSVNQTDVEGNRSAPESRGFSVDRLPPTITITRPLQNALVNAAGVGTLLV